MNAGRYVGASVVVFVVRSLLNWLVYGQALHGRYEAMSAAHSGIFRDVIAGYITLDLIAAFFLTYLIVKAGGAFGGGIKGGVILGVLLAIVGPILYGLYIYFGVTYYPSDVLAIESVYQLVAHAIQGALAAAIYKSA